MEYNAVTIICIIAGAVIGYLLGSVNFAIIVSKIFAHDDIRKHGSGNAGLTNVLRTLGKGPAVITLLGDFSKGILSVIFVRLILHFFAGEDNVLIADYICAYAALLGHVFPVYYGFKGGKGILVTFGTLMILSPASALICLASFIIVVAISKYVSLGSIVAAITFPVAIVCMQFAFAPHTFNLVELLLTLPIVILIVFMHRKNIGRLISHSESKISFHKAK